MAEHDNDHKIKISSVLDKKGTAIYSISPESSLKQMANEMLQRKIGSLVVTDKDGSLTGIISERDFLNGRIHPQLIQKLREATCDYRPYNQTLQLFRFSK